MGVIKLLYIIICILGYFLGVLANELIEQEIKGEGISLPHSQLLKGLISGGIEPINRSFLRWKWLYVADLRKTAISGIVVEFSVIITSLLIYIKYGITGQSFAVFIFIYGLIIISVIDFYTMLIPNHLNLILGGISILFTILGWSVSFGQALLGAFLGGGILLGIRVLSLLIIKKEGMGIGDIKLAFICGLYLGPYKILLGLLISVYISGFLLLLLIWLGKIKKNQYIPYGPFLGGGFIISLVFYENIMKLFWWL